MKTRSKPARPLTPPEERLQVLAAFRASELRYRRLFETAHDGVLLLDPATRKITDANPFMTKLLGYSHDQLVGKELFQIGLLQDKLASREMFRKLKRQHELRYEDLPLKSRGGNHQDVEVVANLYEEDGHPVIQCNIRDITERRRAEKTLNELAAIVKFSSDAIIGKDPYGVITSWNDGAQKIFGYSAREMIGTSIRRLIPADRQNEETNILKKIHRGEMVQRFETLRKTKDGRLISISATLSPIKDAAGKVVGVSKVAQDITDRKAAAEAQKRIDVLGASNKELTLEIAQRKAVEAALKKSEHHYGELLGESERLQGQLRQLSRQILLAQEDERKRISRELHDVIAQTLTGINVRLATLKKEASVNIKGLDRNIARTQRLVEKSVQIIHEFARELRPAVLDDLGLIPALHSFVKLFSKRTRIHVHIKAFAGVEQLDISRRTILYRVAQEALNNVSRHAHASHVVLTIQQLVDGVCMKIKDNGRSFEVEKVLNARGHKRLGLLGMRERLNMVGGRFEIESLPGSGTTIMAYLPAGKSLKPSKPFKT